MGTKQATPEYPTVSGSLESLSVFFFPLQVHAQKVGIDNDRANYWGIRLEILIDLGYILLYVLVYLLFNR